MRKRSRTPKHSGLRTQDSGLHSEVELRPLSLAPLAKGGLARLAELRRRRPCGADGPIPPRRTRRLLPVSIGV
jgi:hypothetical protein